MFPTPLALISISCSCEHSDSDIALLVTNVSSSKCCRRTGKFFWYVFIIFLTLNLMCFYGVMAVYITPDLVIGTIVSSFFHGFWCPPSRLD